MSAQMLVTLTVLEIVALVAVLALFVILLTQRLRSVADALGHVSGVTVRAIQGDVFLVSPGASILNQQLNTIAGALPAIAEKAESLAVQKNRGAYQPRAQDPVTTRRR